MGTQSSPVPDRAYGLPHRGLHHFMPIPRPTLFLTGFTSPEARFDGSEAGKRCSEARCRASEAGSRGSDTRFRASEAGSRGPETRCRASEAGGRGSEARFRASEAGRRSPERRFDGLDGGMNSPVAGIRASEARVSYRVGGKRTPLGRASGPERPRDARRSRRIAAHGRETTAPRAPCADETGMTAQSVQYRNRKEVKEDALL